MNRLKELRKQKNLTQQGLADEISVSKITILRWENSERQIKEEKAQQLADYFGVNVGYLLGYSEYPDKNLAHDDLRKKDKNDFANVAKAKILSLVNSEKLDRIEKKYVSNDGEDWDHYIDFLRSINILENWKESDLLVWSALLDDKKQGIVLDLAKSLATED